MKSILKSFAVVSVMFWSMIAICYTELPELSSNEPIEFDDQSDEVILRGDAELSTDSALVRADEIRFNHESSSALATGNVSINTQDLRLIGEAIQYNITDESLGSGLFRAGRPPLYITGRNASGTLNDLDITQPILILGEPDFISPNFWASRVKLKHAHDPCTPTKIIAHHILFKMGQVPFFYLPYFSSTTLQKNPLSIESDFGNSKEYGRYLRNTVFFRLTPYLKLGALLDFYEDRGVLAGPALDYGATFGCNSIRGNLQTGFIHDKDSKKELGVDSVGRPTPRHRYFIEWYHQQELPQNFQITSQLRRWSDSNSLRDFRPKLFNHDNDPDNFVEAVYTGKNYYLTGFTRYSPNNFQDIQQRIPELNFNLLPTRIGCTPVFQTINARIAHLHENKALYREGHDHHHHHHHNNTCDKHHKQTSDRMDIFYGLHAPFTFGDEDIITFTPLIGGQVDEYFKKSTSDGHYTRLRGQVGFDLQLNSYAQWDCQNKTWDIDGLRHILRPIVQYRFIPEHHSGRGPVPQIDRRVFTTNMHPIDLNYLREIDDAHKRNVVRFGLENVLQTRNPQYGSRELAYLNIYQDYLIRREPFHLNQRRRDFCNDHKHTKKFKHDHWSDLYTELGLSPAYWLNFKLYNRIDVVRGKLVELNTSLTLKDARFWSITYTTDFLHRRFEREENRYQHCIQPKLHLTPRTYVAAEVRYDCKTHLISKETYAINTQFSNAWGAEFQVIHRRHAIRESKWEIGLVISLLPINLSTVEIPIL